VGQRQPQIFYYEADGLGSVTSLTTPTGTVAATYTYDSFGFMTASTGSATNWFRYTARQFDSDTGLYNYRARYYDPAIGRFISEDPIGFYGGVNFYRYTSNSPVNFTDPLGWYTQVITFDPVGYGRSSMGHTAIDVNGMTYSFGENGWFSQPTIDFLARNNFRDATGQVLNMTPEQEGALVAAIQRDMAEKQKWDAWKNNCSQKARDMLQQAAPDRPFSIPMPSQPPLMPADFRDTLSKFGYVTQTNYYPRAKK